MAVTDAQLEAWLARSLDGDRGAFHQLYDATSPRVYAVLMKLLAEPAMAQDVLQDTYVKVWAQAEHYRSERGLVLSWIISIARYRAIDLLRAQGRRSSHELAAGETQQSTSGNDDPLSDLLHECLAKLADLQRHTIQAAFVHGFTHTELAAREDAPVGTVKSRIRRGLQRLRECMEQ